MKCFCLVFALGILVVSLAGCTRLKTYTTEPVKLANNEVELETVASVLTTGRGTQVSVLDRLVTDKKTGVRQWLCPVGGSSDGFIDGTTRQAVSIIGGAYVLKGAKFGGGAKAISDSDARAGL